LPPVDQGEVTVLVISTRAERLGGTEGNEILTSAAAVVLTLLLIAEGVTIVLIGDLLSAHMFIGMALIPPVLLKLGSTGYRFARYYTGARIYREKAPPALVLRLLAPVLVITTISLITGWHGERRHDDRRRALTGSVAPGAPGQGAQPGVDRREVAIGHDARREETRAVDVAELLELDAVREARAAQALGLVAVTARAAKPAARERLPARRGRSGPPGEGDVELADAVGGLGELASGVDADPVVVGHAAT
jgi:hypothetical protein